MLNYNHFYYFYVTARLGGVSNAAKFLNISQPSLSSQLKTFETTLEKQLFQKKGRQRILSADGEFVYQYAKRMFLVAEEFSDFLKSPQEQGYQKIRIGITEQVERPFVADILAPVLRSTQQKASYTIVAGGIDQLLDQVSKQELDVIFTNKPVYKDGLTEIAVVKVPVNLLIATDLLKSAKTRLPRNNTLAQNLAAIPWGLIIPSYRLKLRHETDSYLQKSQTRKNIAIESDVLSLIGRAISDGAGVGLFPTSYLADEIQSKSVTVLGPKEGYWTHSIYMVGRKGQAHSSVIESMRRSIKNLEKVQKSKGS